KLYIRDGRVSSVSVDMGKAIFNPKQIPVVSDNDEIVGQDMVIGDNSYNVTCVSFGNPHCVVFLDALDALDVPKIGKTFEYADVFPERINTEFVRVVNPTTLRMRVWERGIGETLACGTGACAAVVAATRMGYCEKGKDITVKLIGGDVIVNYTDERVILTGNTTYVYDGSFEY
ncbi:MAG: diaminopimelate epimerase, partial [Clostridia bacterium]|nr:diaminopimelate epimerase [Clostridia bacterium]